MSLPPHIRVLVVDDEAPARRKVLRLLRDEEGVEVVGEADGGEVAIAAVRKHSPDLVFLDVQMPGVDGFGVVRSIVDGKLALPRIIFVTAHDKFALRAFEVHAFELFAETCRRRALSSGSPARAAAARTSHGRFRFPAAHHAGG